MTELRHITTLDVTASKPSQGSQHETFNDVDINDVDIYTDVVTHTLGYDNGGYVDTEQNAQNVPSKAHKIDDFDDKAHKIDDFDDEENEEEGQGCCSRFIDYIQSSISDVFSTYGETLSLIFYAALLAAYFVYFGFALHYKFGDEGSLRLVVCTAIGCVLLMLHFIQQYRAEKLQSHEVGAPSSNKSWPSCQRCLKKTRFALMLPLLIMIGFIIYIVLDIGLDQPRNLIGAAGLCSFILAMFVFSYNPSKVKWRPVLWGLVLQLIFAVLILRTSWGYDAFDWLGSRVTEFLTNTDAGSKFVFGDNYEDHIFAFKVMPVVVFFSTIVSVLYHLGVMQGVIQRLGRFLSWCMGTSPAESINAAGNIFIGQTEAPLMIRPFLADMTESEIHAVMTGGFATVAGSIMATYISFGVPANHLLSASVMSAPAALAISKLFWPETQKPKNSGQAAFHMEKGTERNVIEAVSNGASMSIKLVANIVVNLIAFVALLQFVNTTLTWFGDRVGYDGLTFQVVCSYVFWPLAYMMGVDTKDCRAVAELIGVKTFLNELLAYYSMSGYINNRKSLDEYLTNANLNITGNWTGRWEESGGDIYLIDTDVTLSRGVISERSVVIATYALCGFSNFSSMGMQLGGLGALAPSRKSDMARIVFRAMIAGNVACFMTACIAGIFYENNL